MSDLENRVKALEVELADLKKSVSARRSGDTQPWWERILGSFQNDESYKEAMQHGANYRNQQRSTEDG